MPQYPGPNIAIFTSYFSGGEGPQWTNTTYWNVDSLGLTQQNALSAATAYHTQYGDLVCQLLAQSVSLTATRVRSFKTNALVEAIYSQEKEGEAATPEALPRQDAIVIQKTTGQFGRANQGRIFISGVAETMQVNGELANVARPLAKNVADFLGADRTFALPMNSRHWNRKLNTFVPITACFAIIELKSQRNRQYYKGSTKI
jgi:hypothetical protein